MSQAGSISGSSGGGTPSGDINVIVIPGSTVNLKNLGNTTVLTTGASPFLAINVIYDQVLASGTQGQPVVNMGFTSPNYTDLLTGNTVPVGLQGTVQMNIGFTIGGGILIPASSAIVVKVTTADATATTDSVSFSIMGYYL